MLETTGNLYPGYTHGLTYGVGTNDADFPISQLAKGVRRQLPSYTAWCNMLKRAYAKTTTEDNPSYHGCSVAPEWLRFKAFHIWYTENYISGYALDKDLIVPGNKVYRESSCAYVDSRINNIFVNPSKGPRTLPLGVSINNGYLRAQCRTFTGGQLGLGYFKSPQAAHKAWQLAKAASIAEAVEWVKATRTDERVVAGLQLRIDWLLEDAKNSAETVSLNEARI